MAEVQTSAMTAEVTAHQPAVARDGARGEAGLRRARSMIWSCTGLLLAVFWTVTLLLGLQQRRQEGAGSGAGAGVAFENGMSHAMETVGTGGLQTYGMQNRWCRRLAAAWGL